MGIPLAASEHLPFYVAAGCLAAWAVVIGLIGIKSEKFPGGSGTLKGLIGVTVILVGTTIAMAISTAETPENHNPRPEIALGVVPQPGAAGEEKVAQSESGPAEAPAASAGPVKVAAAAGGQLAYDPKEVSADAGSVEISFSNGGPLPHNLVLANPQGGKPLGQTPVITSGSKSFKVTLAAGTYKFYCSVPGHEAAGMVGQLTVS